MQPGGITRYHEHRIKDDYHQQQLILFFGEKVRTEIEKTIARAFKTALGEAEIQDLQVP